MAAPLAGKVALVTGGAGLIGSAISRRLAQEGATVFINGRDAARAERLAAEVRHQGRAAWALPADVRDEAQVAALIRALLKQSGRLDILVTAAGGVSVAGASGPAYAADTRLDDWHRILELNLTATFLAIRAALPALIRSGAGRIVTISSAGQFGVIGLAPYAAAKSALLGLTRTVALEYAREGLTANVVVPHLTESGRPRPPETEATLLAQVPLRRYGRPEEIAGVVAFLVGPDGGYLTGQVLHVTGGLDWLGPGLDLVALRQLGPR
jgi:NAD(P)-dependent dehydrogenase (short-subunit alcohol dehydrogenase family)